MTDTKEANRLLFVLFKALQKLKAAMFLNSQTLTGLSVSVDTWSLIVSSDEVHASRHHQARSQCEFWTVPDNDQLGLNQTLQGCLGRVKPV